MTANLVLLHNNFILFYQTLEFSVNVFSLHYIIVIAVRFVLFLLFAVVFIVVFRVLQTGQVYIDEVCVLTDALC